MSLEELQALILVFQELSGQQPALGHFSACVRYFDCSLRQNDVY